MDVLVRVINRGMPYDRDGNSYRRIQYLHAENMRNAESIASALHNHASDVEATICVCFRNEKSQRMIVTFAEFQSAMEQFAQLTQQNEAMTSKAVPSFRSKFRKPNDTEPMQSI